MTSSLESLDRKQTLRLRESSALCTRALEHKKLFIILAVDVLIALIRPITCCPAVFIPAFQDAAGTL